ncbi:MAG: glycosyltransferase family 2 protein [Bryobacteraceae bacterium]|jgi:glycosyltransferase involved in cell wall biosynthesis
MPEPLVTVVTPSYNQGNFIRATIESVLSQAYPSVEYIIMDGGSTDETASVVKDYASRLTFISEKDRGQSHAINKGFRMARGSILAWLNSDDVYLPGAIRNGVEGFSRDPAPGAVYGEGYLIDREGKITCRFPHTIPVNLWRLTHVSDYILQQSVYFRKDVLDEVGYLDEDLHYAMDWEILIRIGKKHPLGYIPEYMGCLREYAEAKSSSGGARRVREIRDMLRRHTDRYLPPGYIVYGLDTHHEIWCERIRRTAMLRPIAGKLQSLVKLAAGLTICYMDRYSQGLYTDGWAGPVLRYMLHPGSGPLIVEGTVPAWGKAFRGQKLSIVANGRTLGRFPLAAGDFSIQVELPPDLAGQLLRLRIKASRWIIPSGFTLQGDHRRLAYLVKGIRWLRESERDQAVRTNAVTVGN